MIPDETTPEYYYKLWNTAGLTPSYACNCTGACHATGICPAVAGGSRSQPTPRIPSETPPDPNPVEQFKLFAATDIALLGAAVVAVIVGAAVGVWCGMAWRRM